jgi:hypothetical protein
MSRYLLAVVFALSSASAFAQTKYGQASAAR